MQSTKVPEWKREGELYLTRKREMNPLQKENFEARKRFWRTYDKIINEEKVNFT
jgi:hypothetical protein